MPLARWAFNIRQPLLLENVEPLVTCLTDGDDTKVNIVPVSNLLNYLPKVEADALLQLRLEDDMRRALVGRLMVHAFFTAHHGCQWEDLAFDCSQSPSPVLIAPEHLTSVSFKISHHGDWVILVGEILEEQGQESAGGSHSPVHRLGVDVVDFQSPGHDLTSFEAFSASFQDQFTTKEMNFMAEAGEGSDSGDSASEPMGDCQLRRFYRLWCLKESIVKALDVGIDFNLKSIEFTIQDPEETQTPILSTVIEVHEPKPELLPEEGWSFEEALLDSDHCYAIAAQTGEPATAIMDGSEIKRFDWKELLRDAVPYPVTTVFPVANL
ncbi:hypothetical protein BGZ83_009568 [Gryganskiella cystojenkinii]|nr:hypothetical protein BGZ83_009568 [Gryganskiella cystojenkinii]